jgi:hypothetical protein
VFVREKGLTDIIDKPRDALADHPQFERHEPASDETELRAKMRWPGDDRRRIVDFAVTFIHTVA